MIFPKHFFVIWSSHVNKRQYNLLGLLLANSLQTAMKEGFQNYFTIVFGWNMCLLYVNEQDILFF